MTWSPNGARGAGAGAEEQLNTKNDDKKRENAFGV